MSRRTTTWGLLAAAVLAGLAGAAPPRLWPGLLPAWAGPVLFVFALVLAFAALLRGQLPEPCDSASPGLRRRYTRELLLAMGAYTLVLFASVWLLRHVEAPALRALVALLPVPPIAFALRGGFLQTAKVIDLPAGAVLIWLFPLVCLTYGLAKVVVARRYR